MLGQTCFDLAQLDTEAADLHLMVVPPEELQVAVGQITRQVSGAVHARAQLATEGIGEEALRGQLRAVQIAARHTRSTDVHLAHRAEWHRLPVTVQKVNPCVQNWAANRLII
ncbi:hypothetical protein GCM10011585_37310 [Edaphobacter dinghuensis]|uniref:Uncharacterized protein n=1 Tax=Edaphobacter dinghuensis TaxID=1560005 RepID=A0A917HTP8_9BACT|nr:hypothetical protein [Edaphobacter dinghuensis]GGG89598.1 hypothetical protein GCM10011585_37310 [Edaphobacter dinghuensis]